MMKDANFCLTTLLANRWSYLQIERCTHKWTHRQSQIHVRDLLTLTNAMINKNGRFTHLQHAQIPSTS